MFNFWGGFIIALFSALCFGTYFVPMKKIKNPDPYLFQMIMAIAILVFSSVIAIFNRNINFDLLSITAGIIWAVGNILSVLAVNKSGLSKSAPVWMGTGIITSFSWGIFVFNEQLKFLPLALVGTIVILTGLWLLSQISETSKTVKSNAGILYAFMAGLLFASYLIPVKYTSLGPIEYMFPMSIGIFLAAVATFFIKRPKVDTSFIKPGLISGFVWSLGNLCLVYAILNIGLSLAFPLSQIALFVSVTWGIVFFKEIKHSRSIKRIVYYSLFLFSGVILISLSK